MHENEVLVKRYGKTVLQYKGSELDSETKYPLSNLTFRGVNLKAINGGHDIYFEVDKESGLVYYFDGSLTEDGEKMVGVVLPKGGFNSGGSLRVTVIPDPKERDQSKSLETRYTLLNNLE